MSKVSGSLENMKGRVKQAVGAVTGDKKMEAEGAYERTKGSAKESVEKAKEKVNEKLEDEGDDQNPSGEDDE
jgi:uncharacterized protein YjbJ (UPF0337 family)